MLEIRKLNKSFGSNKVLKSVDIKINQGEVVAILGPSGSGKTTLLRCISYLEKADSGSMIFDGLEYDMGHINKSSIHEIRMKLGFVFQNFNLFRNMTVIQNVMEGLVTARKIGKTEAKQKALKLLSKVGMEEKQNAYPDEISGGQQQRVAIVRALAMEPKVILFDEPTSALDPELTVGVLTVIKRLAEVGKTMLIVTHEMEFARQVADRIIFMEDGVVVEDSPADLFFSNPKEERSAQFVKTLSK